MAKFSGPQSRTAANRGPLRTTTAPLATHEGGAGYRREPRSELFLTAVTEMAEDTFYESAPERRARIAGLVAAVASTSEGDRWLRSFIPWLRHGAHMRSAPVILLAEMAAAGCTDLRPLVTATLARPDEPAELLGYWLATHGRRLPAGLKRGIADAAVNLYSQRSALRWDGQSRLIRMADVIELTHPSPRDEEQSALFRHLIDRRHNRPEPPPPLLGALGEDHFLQHLPTEERRGYLRSSSALRGWSWERLAGWLPGGMDAAAWEAIIPSMGYMALLRNLRNFDDAGVDKEVLASVAARLADPEQVRRSRQFPYRFLSAWKAVGSMHWGPALEAALDHSVGNVPALPGASLICVDTSGSMQSPCGGRRSELQRWEAAALFGTVLARRAAAVGNRVDLVVYATDSARLEDLVPSQSILRHVEAMAQLIGQVGYGTSTWAAIARWYGGHDRVIVLTDEQSHDSGGTSLWERHGTGNTARPWLHFVNLAGYRAATAPPDSKTFTYGGFTDAMFTLMPLLEAGAGGHWPWEGR